MSGTTLADDATAVAWVEDAGNDASQLSATPLVWDNANNTLLVRVDHGINNLLLSASVHTLDVRKTDYLLYTYDAGDQFNLTEGSTTTTLAGFELQLTAHLNAATAGAFAAGDIAAITYQALAANTSVFSLGT